MQLDFTANEGAWGWRRRRSSGIWKHGPEWAKPLVCSAPWLTLGLLVLMLELVSHRFVSQPGVVFDLPAVTGSEDAAPEQVALMTRVAREGAGNEETLVFFDDARYVLADETSASQLAARLGDVASRVKMRKDAVSHTLLLLCERRVEHGEVMKFVDLARKAGFGRVQIAEKPE